MKTSSPYTFVLALLLALCIAVPADVIAAPQSSNSRAGEVARVIPSVSIARGSKTLTASAKSVIDWLDLVNTQTNGRARIALDELPAQFAGAVATIKSFTRKPLQP